MPLFDASKYEIPSVESINMSATRKDFETFIQAYKNSREKVGQPRVPKVTQSFSLIPPSTVLTSYEAERILIQNEEAMEEYMELHHLFVKGYSAISHAIKADVTERRRQIFLLRYLNGFTVFEVIDLMAIGKDIVSDESREALLQFCNALGMIVRR